MEKRIGIALYVVIFIFAVFVFRLWHLQVVRGNEYKKIDERNRLRVIDIHAPRGIIYDRNNKALVKNMPSFDISVVKEDLSRDPRTLSALGALIGLSLEDISARLRNAPARPFESVILKQDVSFEEVARIEARRIDFPGLQVDVVEGRQYNYGHSSSHILGYLGRLTAGQISSPQYIGLPHGTFVGQFGVEKTYDDILRGIPGKKIIEVNAVGNIVKVVRIQRPIKGKDINLAIDINLQVEAERSLRGKTGAVVALNPGTGEVLALASAPTFDPNVFVRGIKYSDWKRLVEDPRKPLLNRAIQSRYPPGSTFKVVTAIAALEEGIVTRETSYNCKGSIYFGRVYRCWKKGGHGNVRLYKSIVESCDVYFYEIAKKLNVDILAQYAFGFGLGRPTGIELDGEVGGLVPTSGWKREVKKEAWYTGETLNSVIGQGYVSATPIQMARLMAAVVNGGRLYEPHLLMPKGAGTETASVVKIRPGTISLIKKALLGVVKDKHGTGRLARSDIVSIGGKTGTTQVIGGVDNQSAVPEKFRDHAWFIGFAPEYDPQIAVAVFVEHGGHGSTGAAPIAKRIIEAYYMESKG